MPRHKLDDALEQLVRAELIFRRGTPPEAEYTFKHALVQDAAYSTLLRSRREQLHARIAATIEDRFRDVVTAQPALLAQHCAEAGLAKKAVGYWLKAGQQALARSAMTEAVAQLQKGLARLAGLPDDPWRRQDELDLQIALGPALAGTMSYPAMGETLARARALAEQLDRPEYLVPVLYGQWQYHLVRAEYKPALSVPEQLEKTGETQNDITTQLMAYHAIGLVRLCRGELVAARAVMERCRHLADPIRRTVSVGMNEDPYVATLANLAVTLTHLGYLDQARLQMRGALSEARRLNHSLTLTIVLAFANGVDLTIRSPERKHAQELLDISKEHGFSHYLSLALIQRGSSLIELGQAQEGLTMMIRGLAEYRSTGALMYVTFSLAQLAQGYALLGRPVDGLNCLAEAAQIIERTEERIGEAELHRLQGDLLNAVGDRNARIAMTLESRFSERVAGEPAILAHHCTEAGLYQKAIGYWLNAGREGVARSATTVAVSQLQKGLDLLGSLPEDPWRMQQELDLQIALNQALVAARGYSARLWERPSSGHKRSPNNLVNPTIWVHCSVHNGFFTTLEPNTNWRCRLPMRWRKPERHEAMNPRCCLGNSWKGSVASFWGTSLPPTLNLRAPVFTSGRCNRTSMWTCKVSMPGPLSISGRP
jgi:tetratricopeptide (TPR) repeat protein